MSVTYAASDILSHGSLVALPLVFFAGAVAGLNPCCVALYPSAAAVCCGTGTLQGRRFTNSIALVFGVAATTTVFGIVAALAGRIVGQFGSGVRYVVAAVPLIMGLHLLGWLRLPLGLFPKQAIRTGWLGAFGAGLLLAFALTPCGTPVLASVLSYVAYKGSVAYGALLLLLYGVGWGIPIVLVGTAAGRLTARLEQAGYGMWTERISGTALVALGLFLLWRA